MGQTVAEEWKEIEAKMTTGTPMICRECGRNFTRKIGKRTYEVKCPKCGGYDTDVR